MRRRARAHALRPGVQEFEAQHRDRNGEVRDVLVRACGVVLDGEDITYTAYHDITERKAAEAALRAREAEFRAIFETSAAGMTEVDLRTGRYLRVKPRAAFATQSGPMLVIGPEQTVLRESLEAIVEGLGGAPGEDWLMALLAPLTEALAAGTLRWLTCRRMRDELERTLAYPALAKWNPDSEHVLTIFDRQGTAQPDPPPAPLDLRCSDPDDQVFLDLALATRARWLLTHDRALLKLARRAGRSGLHILPPASWPGP